MVGVGKRVKAERAKKRGEKSLENEQELVLRTVSKTAAADVDDYAVYDGVAKFENAAGGQHGGVVGPFNNTDRLFITLLTKISERKKRDKLSVPVSRMQQYLRFVALHSPGSPASFYFQIEGDLLCVQPHVVRAVGALRAARMLRQFTFVVCASSFVDEFDWKKYHAPTVLKLEADKENVATVFVERAKQRIIFLPDVVSFAITRLMAEGVHRSYVLRLLACQCSLRASYALLQLEPGVAKALDAYTCREWCPTNIPIIYKIFEVASYIANAVPPQVVGGKSYTLFFRNDCAYVGSICPETCLPFGNGVMTTRNIICFCSHWHHGFVNGRTGILVMKKKTDAFFHECPPLEFEEDSRWYVEGNFDKGFIKGPYIHSVNGTFLNTLTYKSVLRCAFQRLAFYVRR